ncbi:MAG: lipopolysaccharide biosynthesis protein [Solirubrobacterales bacterium]
MAEPALGGDGATAPADGARGYGRRASLLSLGVGATGLVTYLYFAIASHELSRTDYGEIAILWSAVFITVSTLQRPIEQLLSRTIAEHTALGQSPRRPMRVAATIQAMVAAAFVGLALAFRGPLQDNLLSGNQTLYWVYVASVTAYGASYFARGFLAGSHRLPLYAGLILSESLSRTMFPLAVALGIASGQSAVALGIIAAPCLSLVVVPFAFTRSARAGVAQAKVEGATAAGKTVVTDSEFSLAHGGSFAAAVLGVMLAEQIFLNAGPLLVKANSGTAAAGFVFNILMIARAPIQLFQAVQTSLLPHLTRLRSSGAQSDEDTFRASVRVTIMAVAGFAALVGLAMLFAGPALMHIAFGSKFDYPRGDLLIVTAGMGIYLSAGTLNQAALAQGQVRRAAGCWILCAVAFVIWCALPVLDEIRRVEVGYLGASALLLTLLYAIYRAPVPRSEDMVEPGSPQELEAQIAAGDEAG